MQPIYQLGVYEKSMPNHLPLDEKLSEAKAAGYDFLELSIDETDEKLQRLDWTADDVNALRHAMESRQIDIRTMCLSGHRRFPLGDPDPRNREKSLDIMKKAIRLASALGIRIIQIAGYDVYYCPSNEETKRLFAQSLSVCVEQAAAMGVMLAFETMETEFIDTVEKAMRWVSATHSAWLQVYPDLGNITNAQKKYHASVVDDLSRARGRFAAMHLKETLPGVYREVAYGDGHVDFCRGVSAALEMGARLFVGEFWYTGDADWRSTLRENRRFLRTAIERAFGTEPIHAP